MLNALFAKFGGAGNSFVNEAFTLTLFAVSVGFPAAKGVKMDILANNPSAHSPFVFNDNVADAAFLYDCDDAVVIVRRKCLSFDWFVVVFSRKVGVD